MKTPILILDFDRTIAFTYSNGITIFRPYISEFLDAMMKKYTILVWTAGTMGYVLPRLMDTGLAEKLYGILTFENLTPCGQFYVKDISIFGLDVNDITIIDDNQLYTCIHPTRRITIKPFVGDLDDTELLTLVDKL